MTFKSISHAISIWIIIIPLVAGFINYKGLNKDSRLIFFLVLIGVIPQMLTFIINEESPVLNYSYNIYTPVEFFIIRKLFSAKYQNKVNDHILYYSAFAYAAISVIFLFTHDLKNEFINVWACTNNLFYILWILLYLQEQYNSENITISKKNPFSWYLMAFIIYAPCSLLVVSLYHYIRSADNAFVNNLWIIQNLCNILLYVFFTIGLLIPKSININVNSA